MLAKAGSEIPIRGDDIVPYTKRATELLTSIAYAPKKDLGAHRRGLSAAQSGKKDWSDSRAAEGSTSPQSVSLITIAEAANKGDKLLDERINRTLNILREGIKVALHVATLYAKFSGFETLRERNQRNALTTDGDKAEWAAKQETHAAISAFVLALYVCWRFESEEEKGASVSVDFVGLPESVAIGNQIRAFGSVFYHLGSYLKEAQTGEQFLRLTQLYFAAVLTELKGRAPSFKYTETFTDQIYRLEGTTFKVNGFDGQVLGGGVVEFKRVELAEVVGNHEAKRLARRLAQFVMAYDFTRQKNPMMALGAFPWLYIYQGVAGTGKSMLLSVTQTLVQDYCRALGVPFRLHPIPNAIISSLQGESAAQYERWWSVLQNPSEIIVAPVDDAEAVYLDRRDESSSEGSKMIVMTHLRLTEGSTALMRGNVLQPHATNNADMIDQPVFSRYQARVIVPGAETRNDFADQMKMWGDKLNTSATKPILKLQFPNDYAFLSDQGLVPRDEQESRGEKLIRFKNRELVELWEMVERMKLSINSYDLYGTFFELLHKKFAGFTSRDVRNICVCATSRLFGFDFPDEWLESKDAFVGQDYERKQQMILDMALQHQQGLTVEQVLFEEMVHYVETTIAMLDSGRQFRIRQMADQMLEREEAARVARAQGART